jgi:uncharacterized membrane protein
MPVWPALAAAILAGLLSLSPALAQTAPVQGIVGQITLAEIAPSNDASLTHSAFKATTFKLGTTVTNLTLLSYATGGVVGGVALTAFITASSWLLYTANDYAWDTYDPPPPKLAANESFDASGDVWRNTKKFLTFKPVIASLKVASLFVWTGSVATTAVFGTAAIVTNTAVFYVNNVAWDFYDWYVAPPVGTTMAER